MLTLPCTNLGFSFVRFVSVSKGTQKWEQKAVEAKERYVKQMKEFEANGGGKEVSKKRGSKTTRKAPAKKGKKKNDSEDDDDEEDESD